jgi:hypothetical protein
VFINELSCVQLLYMRTLFPWATSGEFKNKYIMLNHSRLFVLFMDFKLLGPWTG